MPKRRDPNTPDMFTDWQPPQIAAQLPPEVVCGGTLPGQIARAVSRAMKNCSMSRDEIAEQMSAYLGTDVSVNMLCAYASEARESHAISFERLIALIHVTGELGLLGFAAEQFGMIVVPEKFSSLIELHFIEEQEERLKQRKAANMARWRAGQ